MLLVLDMQALQNGVNVKYKKWRRAVGRNESGVSKSKTVVQNASNFKDRQLTLCEEAWLYGV